MIRRSLLKLVFVLSFAAVSGGNAWSQPDPFEAR